MITLSLADLPIGIDNRFDYLEALAKDYRTDAPPTFTVAVNDEEIAAERAASEAAYADEGFTFTDGYLESIVAYRKIAERLPDYDAAVFHGAVLVLDGKAFAFTARSGTGKTTHIRLWKKVYGDRVFVLNGDKPILRKQDGKIYAYGTPWRGKENYGRPGKAPLGGIAFLERAKENSAAPLATSDAAMRFLSQIYLPKTTPLAVSETMALADAILSSVPLFRLGVNMEEDAAVVAKEALTGKKDENVYIKNPSSER